jgi:soluble lytic murein transglycosylase
MTVRKRALFAVAAEILVMILAFCTILVAISSDRTMTEFDKREYPKKYSNAVDIAAAEFGIPENLIYAVIKAESDFDERAVSSAGALGLMQIMPATYESDIKPKLGFEASGKEALFDYMINIRSGAYYLSYLYKYCGDLETTLAMYNAGIGNVSTWLKSREYSYDGKKLILGRIPIGETRSYVARVMYYYERYEAIYGKGNSDIIEDPIFEKYGVNVKWVTKNGEGGKIYVNELACYAWAMHYAEIYPEADPIFVMAIIKTESDFCVNAVSKSGAYGLMQIMPVTYSDIQGMLETDKLFEKLKEDPQFAIQCGMCYIQWLHTPSLEIGNDKINIAAAYNGGPGNVSEWLKDKNLSNDGVLIADNIPRAETNNYVKKVMNNYEYYREYLGEIFSKEN